MQWQNMNDIDFSDFYSVYQNRSAQVRDLLSNSLLSVSCKNINHSRYALVIIYSLQLTASKILLNNSLQQLIYFLHIARTCSKRRTKS